MTTDASPSLRLERNGSVSVITFNRPERMNAFGATELRALRVSLMDVAQDPESRAVVLTGAGKAFSAGGDVQEMNAWLEKGVLPRQFHDLVGEQERCILEIVGMAKPVVAAIPGVAAGGGMSMALACDWRIATPESSLVVAFPTLGAVPDGGMTYFLPHYLGIGAAQEILYGGGRIKAERARELSLFHEIVPGDQLASRALERARELAKGPTRAYGRMKRLLLQAFEGSLERQMELERVGMVESSQGPEMQEGIRAFNQKRPPRFEEIPPR